MLSALEEAGLVTSGDRPFRRHLHQPARSSATSPTVVRGARVSGQSGLPVLAGTRVLSTHITTGPSHPDRAAAPGRATMWWRSTGSDWPTAPISLEHAQFPANGSRTARTTARRLAVRVQSKYGLGRRVPTSGSRQSPPPATSSNGVSEIRAADDHPRRLRPGRVAVRVLRDLFRGDRTALAVTAQGPRHRRAIITNTAWSPCSGRRALITMRRGQRVTVVGCVPVSSGARLPASSAGHPLVDVAPRHSSSPLVTSGSSRISCGRVIPTALAARRPPASRADPTSSPVDALATSSESVASLGGNVPTGPVSRRCCSRSSSWTLNAPGDGQHVRPGPRRSRATRDAAPAPPRRTR